MGENCIEKISAAFHLGKSQGREFACIYFIVFGSVIRNYANIRSVIFLIKSLEVKLKLNKCHITISHLLAVISLAIVLRKASFHVRNDAFYILLCMKKERKKEWYDNISSFLVDQILRILIVQMERKWLCQDWQKESMNSSLPPGMETILWRTPQTLWWLMLYKVSNSRLTELFLCLFVRYWYHSYWYYLLILLLLLK